MKYCLRSSTADNYHSYYHFTPIQATSGFDVSQQQFYDGLPNSAYLGTSPKKLPDQERVGEVLYSCLSRKGRSPQIALSSQVGKEAVVDSVEHYAPHSANAGHDANNDVDESHYNRDPHSAETQSIR